MYDSPSFVSPSSDLRTSKTLSSTSKSTLSFIAPVGKHDIGTLFGNTVIIFFVTESSSSDDDFTKKPAQLCTFAPCKKLKNIFSEVICDQGFREFISTSFTIASIILLLFLFVV
jgi:hypothetical protein